MCRSDRFIYDESKVLQGDTHVECRPVFVFVFVFVLGSIRISYAHWPLGRSPTAAARTARGVGRLGKTAR